MNIVDYPLYHKLVMILISDSDGAPRPSAMVCWKRE